MTEGPARLAPPSPGVAPEACLGGDGDVASHVAVAADALLGHGHRPVALPLVAGERAVPAVRASLLRREAEDGLARDPLLLVRGAGDLDVQAERLVRDRVRALVEVVEGDGDPLAPRDAEVGAVGGVVREA